VVQTAGDTSTDDFSIFNLQSITFAIIASDSFTSVSIASTSQRSNIWKWLLNGKFFFLDNAN